MIRRAALAFLVVSLACSSALHAGKDKEAKKGGALARTRSALGTIWALGKEAPLELYADIDDKTTLLVPPGERGVLDVKEGDLRVVLVGNLPELSPSPVLETVVQVAAAKDVDLDLALERGIVVLETGKDSPGGKARVRVHDKSIEVALEKNSAVAFEVYGYWPTGTPFVKDAKGRRPADSSNGRLNDTSSYQPSRNRIPVPSRNSRRTTLLQAMCSDRSRAGRSARVNVSGNGSE
jgi:hypothetical protein